MTEHDESNEFSTPESGESGAGSPLGQPAEEAQHEPVIAALRTVFDPEIPVNIYDLGLVYKVDVDGDGKALITMTLTSPHCPAAEMIPADVKSKVGDVEGITDCEVEIVWEPTWDKDMMSEAAKLQLGFE
jgi:FeS assembly SUF system protein